MARTRIIQRLLALSAVIVATSSCGDAVRTGSAPVFLVIDLLQAAQGAHPSNMSGNLLSDVLTMVASPPPCSQTSPCPTIFNDVALVKLRMSMKNIGNPATPTAPSSNNEVTITRYHVTYRRADGRNTPGVDVPWGFDGAATGTVPAGGTLTLGFEIVRSIAKSESPLVQLAVNPNVISTIADVTFYGHDQTGNEISVTGSMLIDFANFGDQ